MSGHTILLVLAILVLVAAVAATVVPLGRYFEREYRKQDEAFAYYAREKARYARERAGREARKGARP